MAFSERHVGTVLLFAFIWCIGLCAVARGVEFAGGTGRPDDPYQVATAAQLLAIDSAPELQRKHYVLAASIDLAGTTWSGPLIPVFMGVFDGNGWTIQNLQASGSGPQGLFGIVWPEAEVRNLGVVDVRMTAHGTCGALARTNFGRLVDCYSTGTIAGGAMAGGLVGKNSGTMVDCSSVVVVEGADFVGGLTGRNTGEILSCHSTGEATGDSYVGGLVGDNLGKISTSYSTAVVAGTTMYVGGLVGLNFGQIDSSYTDAAVLCYDTCVGGLVGENAGVVMCCYSAGVVEGEDFVGGLVGAGIPPSRISASYTVAAVATPIYSWHCGGLIGSGTAEENCYFPVVRDGGGPDNQVGTPLTLDEMRQLASFADWDFWGTDDDGRNNHWYMPEGLCPVLAWQTEITGLHAVPNVGGSTLEETETALTAAGFVLGEVEYDFDRAIPAGCVIRTAPYGLTPIGTTIDLIVSSDGVYAWTDNAGNGTLEAPYQIATPGQLDAIGGDPALWDKHFVLSADLDMTGRVYETALIAPDTDDLNRGFQGTPFRGTFDGQGYAIRNLTIARVAARHECVGLFGRIAESGRISNLCVLNADVEGGSGTNSLVGVLAGSNAGTISNCSATGCVCGGKGDGLAGENTGVLDDCHADVLRH